MYFSAAVAVEYDNFEEPVAFLYLQCDNATKESFEGCRDISTSLPFSSLAASLLEELYAMVIMLSEICV